MIKIRKTGTLALAGLLGAALLTGGAFAYFTDADSAVNTFTVGSVKIDLQEPDFNEDEGINITPGKTVEKAMQNAAAMAIIADEVIGSSSKNYYSSSTASLV